MSLPGGWRGRLLALLTLACVVAAFAVPAIPQPASYHEFADCRRLLGIPNLLNVLSNLPFAIAGVWGLAVTGRGGGAFGDPREALPYLVFFVGALLTCAGSAWYHWAPDNARLVWDRLPMTLGFAGLVAAALAERFDARIGARALFPLLGIGVLTVLYWHGTERAGVGDLVPYAAFQAWSVLVIAALLALFPASRYTHGHLLVWAVGWYAAAKVAETFDLAIYRLSATAVSGHTVKHLLAALAVFAIVQQLRLRQPAAAMQPGRSCPSIPAA